MEAYLLGTCEPELAFRIDERLFSDDAFYEQLQQVKASLIARDLAGTLPALQHEQLSQQRARSPHLETEVQRAAERQSHEELPSARIPAPGGDSYRRFRVIGLVTASLLVLIGLTSIVRTAKHNADRSQSTLAAKLAPSPVSPHPEAGPKDTAMSIFLPASVLRGESNMPVVHVPDAARPVELQIEILGQEDNGSVWSVALYRGSERIFNLSAVSEKAIDGLRYASIPLPAGTLAPGVYQLLLTPEGPARDTARKVPVTRRFRVG